MAKAVRYEYHGSSVPTGAQPFKELKFTYRVDCGGRFIDDDKLCVSREETHEGPCTVVD